MSTSAVIVALPRPLDPIRLVGDEEKHATILYFGETSSLPSDAKQTIIETLQNISRMFPPFSESVLTISRLGTDNPPALVAMLTGGALNRIRESLLINPAIGSYLSNTNQHPGYTPHVTFGYPDFQQEAELRKLASDLIRVRFDRLALWWNDERIEFSLIDPIDSEMAQSTTLSEAEDALAHYGVKGQKWGVRRELATVGAQAKTVLANKKVKATVTAGRVAITSPEVRKEAAQAGKAAFTIGKYGLTPLAAATGIGIPAIAGLGVSVKVLSDPAVRAAVVSAAKYSAGVAKQVGPTAMSAVKQVNQIDANKFLKRR